MTTNYRELINKIVEAILDDFAKAHNFKSIEDLEQFLEYATDFIYKTQNLLNAQETSSDIEAEKIITSSLEDELEKGEIFESNNEESSEDDKSKEIRLSEIEEIFKGLDNE